MRRWRKPRETGRRHHPADEARRGPRSARQGRGDPNDGLRRQGFGRQRGRTETYRGREYTTALLRKIALEIVVNDDFLDRTVEAITQAARTGREGAIGDGKIFVLPAAGAVQIDDGARGPGAV